MIDDDCLFCKIAAGQIPSAKVYEDECVLAFDDVNPQMPVHTLIVPKNHYENLSSELSQADAAALVKAVPQVAKAKGIDASGYRVLCNNGSDAQQVVKHVHLHILGGAPMNDGDPSITAN